MSSRVSTVIKSMRAPFLVLTPVCVFLGICAAYRSQASVELWQAVLVMIGAMASHISVNTFNEYFDFRSGLDAVTTKTPFSGGSGALVEDPVALNAVLSMAIFTLVITIGIGLYFVQTAGTQILLIGLVGVVIILTYTSWLNRYPWLCLIAPGLAFGPLMVIGTNVVLTGEVSQLAVLVSLLPFFLTNNLLLLNQFPDIEADATVGRNHFPIRYGVRVSSFVYGGFVLASAVVVGAGIAAGSLPTAAAFCAIPLAAAMVSFVGSLRHAAAVERLVPFLGLNVVAALLTPTVLGLALLLG